MLPECALILSFGQQRPVLMASSRQQLPTGTRLGAVGDLNMGICFKAEYLRFLEGNAATSPNQNEEKKAPTGSISQSLRDRFGSAVNNVSRSPTPQNTKRTWHARRRNSD